MPGNPLLVTHGTILRPGTVTEGHLDIVAALLFMVDMQRKNF
jgi:hypothetical protein